MLLGTLPSKASQWQEVEDTFRKWSELFSARWQCFPQPLLNSDKVSLTLPCRPAWPQQQQWQGNIWSTLLSVSLPGCLAIVGETKTEAVLGAAQQPSDMSEIFTWIAFSWMVWVISTEFCQILWMASWLTWTMIIWARLCGSPRNERHFAYFQMLDFNTSLNQKNSTCTFTLWDARGHVLLL